MNIPQAHGTNWEIIQLKAEYSGRPRTWEINGYLLLGHPSRTLDVLSLTQSVLLMSEKAFTVWDEQERGQGLRVSSWVSQHLMPHLQHLIQPWPETKTLKNKQLPKKCLRSQPFSEVHSSQRLCRAWAEPEPNSNTPCPSKPGLQVMTESTDQSF